MEIRLDLDKFTGHELILKIGPWAAPRLSFDGIAIPAKKGSFFIRNNEGKEVEVRPRFRLVDAVPRLEVDGQAIELMPPLEWYEYAWICLPGLLLFIGGAIGGLLGFLAAYVNGRIFRSASHPLCKYLLSGLVSLAAAVLFLIAAAVVLSLIGKK